MYVVGYAKKNLKIGPGDVRNPGDPVPEAQTWKSHILQSHLSMKFIQTKEEFDMWKRNSDAQEALRLKSRERNRKRQEQAKLSQELAQQAAILDEKMPVEAPVEASEVTPEPTSEAAPVLSETEMSKSDLQEIAREMGLPVKGNKIQLIERINAARSAS